MTLPVLDHDARAEVDGAFREGGVRAPLPTRLLVNLGERCNLRCVHCITDAPKKTLAGTARVLGDDVLRALAPVLPRTAWLGLVHAGEPLLQPAFRSLLVALRAARAGRPTVVHLLSNGMALDEERFVDIVGAGVRSLSISLEGLSAESNDDVRHGSRVTVLLPRLARFAALRRERQLDVRLGISTVVTVKNLGELPGLVEFAADIGLDWLKIEEIFPIDDAGAALVPDLHDVARALAAARAKAKTRGVVLVDHTRARRVWRCRLHESASDAAFAAADDTANRVEINPCRLPYEQACVEPDGDVRPVDFHHPVAGNVLTTPWDELWNAPACVEVRRAMRALRPCGAGPTTCGPDPGPTGW